MNAKQNKNNGSGKNPWVLWTAVILCLALVCGVVAWMLCQPETAPDQDRESASAETKSTGMESEASAETVETAGSEAVSDPVETAPSATDPTSDVTEVTSGAADPGPVATQPQVTDPAPTERPQEPTSARLEEVQGVSIELDKGLRIIDVGKYAGVFMEDGSDDIVSGVMMITVKNEGTDTIQYAEIYVPVGDQTASFYLTTLPPGKSAVLLELDRMSYVSGTYTEAEAKNVAVFEQPLGLCEDRLKLQILNGAINITNISGRDITGDIVIYFKNSASDVYYGGITYRVRIADGLKANEVRQIVANHFSASGSAIMFVTCGEG